MRHTHTEREKQQNCRTNIKSYQSKINYVHLFSSNEISSIILSSHFQLHFCEFAAPARSHHATTNQAWAHILQRFHRLCHFNVLMTVNDWKGVLCTIHRFLFTASNAIEDGKKQQHRKLEIYSKFVFESGFFFASICFFIWFEKFENWKHRDKKGRNRELKKETVQCSREIRMFAIRAPVLAMKTNVPIWREARMLHVFFNRINNNTCAHSLLISTIHRPTFDNNNFIKLIYNERKTIISEMIIWCILRARVCLNGACALVDKGRHCFFHIQIGWRKKDQRIIFFCSSFCFCIYAPCTMMPLQESTRAYVENYRSDGTHQV